MDSSELYCRLRLVALLQQLILAAFMSYKVDASEILLSELIFGPVRIPIAGSNSL